jgi:hypothetical protein
VELVRSARHTKGSERRADGFGAASAERTVEEPRPVTVLGDADDEDLARGPAEVLRRGAEGDFSVGEHLVASILGVCRRRTPGLDSVLRLLQVSPMVVPVE